VRVSWIAIPLSLFTVVSTLAGGLTALRLRGHLETVLALSGGVVVAVALFDVLPEAMSGIDDPRRVTTLVAAGFLLFFFFQRLLVLHHRDDPDEARAHHRVGALGAGALSLHSFVDGLGIGLAFGVDTLTGVLVFIAVISHDFADGLNTVTFVLRQRGSRRQALRWLAADAAAPFFGAIVGSTVVVSEQGLAYLLAVYAGFFLYVGASDLLPAAHARTSPLRVALTLAGFVITYAIVSIASSA
jgi:zinc transporter ZupT